MVGVRKKSKVRAEPKMKKRSSTSVWFCSDEAYESLTVSGYTSLAQNPEIVTAVDTIARLIGSMTIYLMENTENGDIRIKNQLSRKIDITPNDYMVRSNFIHWIVKTLMIEGNGNAVVYPEFSEGMLNQLIPIPAETTTFLPTGYWGYKISINGKEYNPDELLHFVLNPDSFYPYIGRGYRLVLSDVANNLKQAQATENGFMQSKWKPSLIVKVDALTDEFSSREGRKKLLDSYVDTAKAGEPWLIPAEQFEVEQVKPLSLADLALSDMVELDKKTVATILGVPPFVLGVGEFQREAWNNFINSKIMPMSQTIEQELTKKLLYSPNFFFKFNYRTLYNYDLKDLAAIADDQYVRGIMTGNEVRDWLNLSPVEDLDTMVILENYIPRGMIGEQSKLNGGEK